MYNILVIGAVATTKVTIELLHSNNFNIVGVLGLETSRVGNVSGWVSLGKLCEKLEIDYLGFEKINDERYLKWANEKKPDIIFAVGFSQLLRKEWLELPTLGCIGFHPTRLPIGRGRAPLAWLVLENDVGASTFFLMGEGADDGPVFVQEEFLITENDDATTVSEKILDSIKIALDRWLPKLKKGEWNPVSQDEYFATYYGIRKPEDGLINWEKTSYEIDRLIKASTHPHPGAYTFYDDQKIIIWKSRVENSLLIRGVIGRVLLKNENREFLVQCGEGLLWVGGVDTEAVLKVGDKFGFNVQNEIFNIKKMLKNISNE